VCRNKLILFTATILLSFFSLLPLADASIYAYSNWKFAIPSYNTYINFAQTTTLSSAYRIGNYWYFNGYKFTVQNANLTINKFFTDNTLRFTLYAGTGTTSTTTIYIPNKGKPSSVTGALTWSYDAATETLTITAVHNSPVTVEIVWNIPESVVIAIRTNYYLVFAVISLMPMVMVAAIILHMRRSEEGLDLKKVVGLVPVFIILFIGFIVIHFVIVSLIGS